MAKKDSMKRNLTVTLTPLIVSLFLLVGCVKYAPIPTHNEGSTRMSNEALQKVRDGFNERVKAAFETEQGKPLVRAKKRPPLKTPRPADRPHGNYVVEYSYSIVDFATRCLLLNEQIAEVNTALAENAQHYLDNPGDILDFNNIHWHSQILCRLIDWYGSRGSRRPGLIDPETERLILEVLWIYCTEWVEPNESNVELYGTWRIYGSDNHHQMDFTTKWHFAKLAKDHPLFRDRKYRTGTTPAEEYAAWNKYIKAYCLERAKKGLFVERGSDNYNTHATMGFHNIYDLADDPELRRRAGCLLDLYWASWAQEQIDGVRGGGRSRVAKHGWDRMGDSEVRKLAWFYFGIGEPSRPLSPLLSALLSNWRPPLVVVDMALDTEGRGKYEIRQRTLGLLDKSPLAEGNGKLLKREGGGIVCYSWCTPSFILGTSIIEAFPDADWAKVASHNRWHGVIFAGDKNARIVPQVDGSHETRNSQWAVQSKGSLICQKLKTNFDATTMRVWFSDAGLTTPTYAGGWFFVEAPQAYAAVRVETGGTEWTPMVVGQKVQTGQLVPFGKWLTLKDEWSPVILEVAEKKDFANYEAFQQAVAALPVSFENETLKYQGLSGDRFSFYADQTRNPEINGEAIDYAPPIAFDSPFIRGAWGSGIIEIAKGERTLTLDFNQK